MKNEERIEMLERKVSITIITGVLLVLAGMALGFQKGTAFVAVSLLIGSVLFLCVSAYYAVLVKKEKRKVKP